MNRRCKKKFKKFVSERKISAANLLEFVALLIVKNSSCSFKNIFILVYFFFNFTTSYAKSKNESGDELFFFASVQDTRKEHDVNTERKCALNMFFK